MPSAARDKVKPFRRLSSPSRGTTLRPHERSLSHNVDWQFAVPAILAIAALVLVVGPTGDRARRVSAQVLASLQPGLIPALR
jgi:hypothetical protein